MVKGDRWNADVVIRRPLSPEKPYRDRVTCYKVTPALAEVGHEPSRAIPSTTPFPR